MICEGQLQLGSPGISVHCIPEPRVIEVGMRRNHFILTDVDGYFLTKDLSVHGPAWFETSVDIFAQKLP